MKNYLLLTILIVSNITMASVAPTSAQEKVCIRTDAGKKVCGNLIKENETEPVSTNNSSVKLSFGDDFTANIKLQKCSRKSSIVSCRLSITQTEGVTKGYTFLHAASGTNASSLINDREDEFIASEIAVGAQKSTTQIGMIATINQPFSATISFKVPSETKTIKELRLSLLFNNGGHPPQIARFFGVNISQ